MSAGGNPAVIRRRSRPATEQGEVAAYCARPGCQKEYRRAIQPGHPQLYCSELCRRQAQQEVRRIRSRLRDLEATVVQHHKLLAAYGSETDGIRDPEEDRITAMRAIDRAGGVIRFLEGDSSPAADELRALYVAVAPLADPPAGRQSS